MKIISKTFKLLTVFALVLGLTACSDDDDNNIIVETPLNIVELASSNPNLSSLVAALQAADGDLPSVLSGPGPFTVLAPTNDAFDAFLGDDELGDIPTDVLAQVLLNHVITGEVLSSDLVAQGSGYASTNATSPGGQNISIYFDTTNGVEFNGVSSVVTGGADVEASNGVVHVVDAVIGIPDVVDHAVANPNLSTLVTALTDNNLVSALQADGPFTVLAPTNDAFANFTNPDGNAIADILLNHVIAAPILSGDLVNLGSGYSNTLATGPNDEALSIYFDTSNGVAFNGAASVSQADIVGSNGVIHVVDNVIDIPTIATFATSNPALSTLVDALVFADGGTPTVPYIDTVSDPTAGPFTVFAPTNDAFGDVLAELSLTGFGEGMDELNAATTDAVLTYHIVAANVQSDELMSGPVATLGGTITADAMNFTLTDPNDRVSNIITSLVDIQGANGVVHVIDTVILPSL